MGWENGDGRLRREGIDTYLQLIHVVVQQKLAQHCKATVLQFKKNPMINHNRNEHLKKSIYAAAAAKSIQSCPTLCDPIDGSPPGSSIHGILQARVLEWVAISFSNA